VGASTGLHPRARERTGRKRARSLCQRRAATMSGMNTFTQYDNSMAEFWKQ